MSTPSSFPSSPIPPEPTSASKKSALLPGRWRAALITLGVLAALMLIAQIINAFSSYWLNHHLAIESRAISGLDGILFAPLLHANWGHLASNMIPLVLFGLLLFAGGARQFIAVTLVVWLVSGIGVWLTGPSMIVTVGFSGVAFGWLAYLAFRGIFTRHWGQIGLGVVLLVVWGGSMFTGIFGTAVRQALGGTTTVSWQAHLFGALGGVLAAYLVARADGAGNSAKKA